MESGTLRIDRLRVSSPGTGAPTHGRNSASGNDASKKKKDRLSPVPTVWGLSSLRTGPILKAPGGWGLRNPESIGPGQRSECFLAIQHGVGLTEFRQYYDLTNVPVTLAGSCGSRQSLSLTRLRADLIGLLRSRPVGAIMSGR